MSYRPAATSLITSIAAGIALAACADPSPTATPTASNATSSFDRAGDTPGTHRQYGTPITLGNGRARSYVTLLKGVPVEV